MAVNLAPATCISGMAHGRIKIDLEAHWLGGDVQILLSGGVAHIGATAICHCGQEPRSLTLDGHRENGIACEIAKTLSRKLKNTVVVTAGIHFDNITQDEIETVLSLCRQLAREFLANMASIEQGDANDHH